MIRSRDDAAATRLAIELMMKILQFAGVTAESGGNTAAVGDQQMLVGGHEVALGGDAAFGARALVGLIPNKAAGAVVAPEDVAGGGVEGVDVYPFGGPDPGGEINDAAQDDRATARRP